MSSDEIIDGYRVSSIFKLPNGKEYNISFNITIRRVSDEYRYIVDEVYDAKLINKARELIDNIIYTMTYNDQFFEDPVKYILDSLDKQYTRGRDKVFYQNIRKVIEYVIIRDVIGYREITPLLSDPDIEDLSLSAPNTYVLVWHKRYNNQGWMKTNIFLNDSEVEKIINKLAFRSGKSINMLSPVLEGVLPENYRVVATWLNEVSPRGSSFTIRKYKSRPYTLTELVSSGVLPSYVAAYLWVLVDRKKFIMIIGPSGVGKTTLLNSLLLLIPTSKRIITIEEIPEVYLRNHIGWKPLTTRWDKDTLDEILNLLKYSLRERADYIILGESRGLEARLVFQGAATGHGCITTFHASTLRELYARLRSKPISLDASMYKLLDTVVIMRMYREGSSHIRRVHKIYRHLNNKWILIYCDRWDDARNRERIYNALDEEEKSLYSRFLKFIKYLVKMKVLDDTEFSTRVNLFYNGKYRLVNDKWILELGVGDGVN